MATTPRSIRPFASFICSSCRQRLAPTTRLHRTFTTTPPTPAEAPPSSPSNNGLNRLSDSLERGPINRSTTPTTRNSPPRRTPPTDPSTPQRISQVLDEDASMLTERFAQNLSDAVGTRGSSSSAASAAHRLHVYATKHNTHITFVQPPRAAVDTASARVSPTSSSAAAQRKTIDVLLSLSTGNLGFRKAGRGSYDAAYQLGAFVLKQIQEKGMLRDVHRLEVVLRGFGAGREAVTKVLLGAEGRRIRGRITAVVDATRLKQGGPRSKKPRRLG